MKYKILLVEDDAVIADQIGKQLEKWDMELVYVKDFADVSGQCAADEPHLVLLDISLPVYNGYYWCGEIRKTSNVPIIFISSANENMNIVMAMNMGGDDFIAKPFDLSVLLAKIQALLRRTYSFSGEANKIMCGGTVLDLSGAVLEYGGNKIELTKNEFRILQLLFQNKGKIVSRDEIIEKLWDDECFVDDNTLAVNMTRLRKKLAENGLEELIVTHKGLGYSCREYG